ncbi:MAG: vanadium-dependent haloperoxidase [Planctomycetota bacterium]
MTTHQRTETASSNKAGDNVQTQSGVSRRNFISAAAMLAGASAAGAPALMPRAAHAGFARGSSNMRRMIDAKDIRFQAANIHFRYSHGLSEQPVNGDDDRYAGESYYASFTKTMAHSSQGLVTPSAYEALLDAIATGDPADFDAIPLDSSSAFALANPQGAYRFTFAGLDGQATRIAAAPSFRSAETAAEMGELYWQAITRDIPYVTFAANRTVNEACDDLNAFSEAVGPVNGKGLIGPQTLFRGDLDGDTVGPYISQFLWKDIPYGPSLIEQKYPVPVAGDDFMVERADWMNILTGGAPVESLQYESEKRYIYNARSLGEYVHGDVLFQAYFNAMLIAFGYGSSALNPGNPYRDIISNQGPFTSLGGPWMIDLLTQAGNLALSGAWYQKWIAHRRLRPEVFGGRLDAHINGEATYEIHPDLLNCEAVQRSHEVYGTYFLPMAYAEGSPTHPAYPAGHACVAGACATVLKAVFDETFVIPDPVIANRSGTALSSYSGETLTLGGEFNKLASNVSIGRDAAGVHYRSDGYQGILCGEQQALALLQDYSLGLNEYFGGFFFTLFDGTAVQVVDGQVIEI